MKTISANLKAGIANGTIATFVKITRTDGVVLGYTDHDILLSYDNVSYVPSPSLQKISMHLRNNAEVSNQEFLSTWDINVTEADLKNGLYDDASIDVFRADYTYIDVSNRIQEIIIIFRGSLGLIQWTDEGYRADVHSIMRQLQRQIGLTYTSKCRFVLYSQQSPISVGACTIDKTSYTENMNIASVTNKLKFTTSGSAQANDYFANGQLTWISGLNTGAVYTVKSFKSSNIFELFLPTVFTININDTFTVSAGCDKTFNTCKTKFSNQLNFGGFPHIKAEINWK